MSLRALRGSKHVASSQTTSNQAALNQSVQTDPNPYAYPLDQILASHPRSTNFRESVRFAIDSLQPKVVAIGTDDRIYIAGDSAVHIYGIEGGILQELALDEPATCMDVDDTGRIYIGYKDRVETISADGSSIERWTRLGSNSWITSIAVAGTGTGERLVYVADAGQKMVFVFSEAGALEETIVRLPVESQNQAMKPDAPDGAFIVPSPYFDLIALPDGGAWIVNPGMHRLLRISRGGEVVNWFGRSSADVDGFSGCCNPVNIALLPSGDLLTCEKGITRVKIVSPEGRLVDLVAGPDQFEVGNAAMDCAVDSTGRIVLLDPSAGAVRIFEVVDMEAGG